MPTNQEILSQENLNKELTVREIWNRILKGQSIRIPNDPNLARQIENHLNVIKSREKKLFLNLGLDFISSIVSVKPREILQIQRSDGSWYEPEPAIFIPKPFTSRTINCFEIKLAAPKHRKTFPCFVIKEEEPKQNDTAIV